MRKVLLFLLFLSSCIGGIAQPVGDSDCPVIVVDGPAGIVAPGETAMYSARIDTKGKQLDLQHIWSVSAGEIVTGQGTTQVEIRRLEKEALTVSLEVKGVPAGCPSIASDTMIVDPAPDAVKLDQFYGSGLDIDKAALDKIIEIIREYPNDQLYVFFGHKRGLPVETAKQRERDVFTSLTTSGLDGGRITFHRVNENIEIIQFWRVPPGANNPHCKECEESVCPTISVIGPAGLTKAGDTVKFVAHPPFEHFEKLVYQWTVLGGTIIEGQGKPWIIVSTNSEMRSQAVTAKVNIDGLPGNCPSKASAKAIVVPM